MELKIYALRDKKSDNFNNPVFANGLGVLVRELTDLVNDGSSLVSKHPSDFGLYFFGTFDNVKGRFELLPLPDLVLELDSLKTAPGPGVTFTPGNGAEPVRLA